MLFLREKFLHPPSTHGGFVSSHGVVHRSIRQSIGPKCLTLSLELKARRSPWKKGLCCNVALASGQMVTQFPFFFVGWDLIDLFCSACSACGRRGGGIFRRTWTSCGGRCVKFNDSDDGPVGCGDFFPLWGWGGVPHKKQNNTKKNGHEKHQNSLVLVQMI